MKVIRAPFSKATFLKLHAGDEVRLSGIVYTARDQAHRRLTDMISRGQKLPFSLAQQLIYYCGPTLAPRDRPIGSCGPTTAARMDAFTEPLLAQGVLGMIGKGRRSKVTLVAMRKHKAVYFITASGCGALLAEKVIDKKLVALPELGPEAIYQLTVKDFPLIVAVDSRGKNLYKDYP